MARYQTIEKLGNKQFTMNHGTLRNAMLYAERHYGCDLLVNDIFMPNPEEDETFFYASVKAAEDDKVWVEECHGFFTEEYRDMLRGGCFDTDDPEDAAAFWKEAVERVRADISGEVNVTGEESQAIVWDADLAEACIQAGLDVLPCGDETWREDGRPNEWWIIFAPGGEDKFFEDVYKEEDMKITDERAYILISQGYNMVLDVMTDTWEDLTGICDGFFPEEPEEPDFTNKDRRREFRREMAKRDSHPQRGTSCFRKGYHKAEKTWKQACRRNRRHNDKAEFRRNKNVNWDDLKVWAESKVFEDDESGFHREAYGVRFESDVRGVYIHILYEVWDDHDDWNDDDAFYVGGQEVLFLTYNQIEELGI